MGDVIIGVCAVWLSVWFLVFSYKMIFWPCICDRNDWVIRMSLSEEFLKNIDLENCDWANDSIKSFRNEEGEKLEKYHDFVTEREEKNQRVAIDSIVWTEHQDYPMRPWIWMIAFGKRMNFALQDYKKNPQYYFLKERQRRV